MEFSVCLLIGLAYSCYIAYYIKTADKVGINVACIAYKAKHRFIFAVTAVNYKSEALQPFNKILYLGFICSFFNCYNHFYIPPNMVFLTANGRPYEL